MSNDGKLWIGLFRGVNVGGNNKLPMKALVQVMEADGFSQVKTYIASGNVVFRAPQDKPELQKRIEDLVEGNFGFRSKLFLVTAAHLEKVLAGNPYRDREHQGKAQHVFFFDTPPASVDRALLDSLKAGSEDYTVTDEVLYLYAPEGIGRSKMVEKIGKAIKTGMTARNLNTVETLLEMSRA
ncbi:MAG: DUF1697 domain-containing protein [Asticcacaulis sp.]